MDGLPIEILAELLKDSNCSEIYDLARVNKSFLVALAPKIERCGVRSAFLVYVLAMTDQSQVWPGFLTLYPQNDNAFIIVSHNRYRANRAAADMLRPHAREVHSSRDMAHTILRFLSAHPNTRLRVDPEDAGAKKFLFPADRRLFKID